MSDKNTELIQLRHWLHQNPEISGKEERTADHITKFLEQYKPDKLIKNLGGCGVAAIYKGQTAGKRILIRAELDALPITETNENLPYKSRNPGKSHKCGHDGHMTIVAGLAAIYAEQRPKKGEVVLLFQPSEENGKGAQAVCEDTKFQEIKPDFAFALHNLPGEQMGTILCKNGPFSASVRSMIVSIEGKTSHAAEPDKATPASAVIPDILAYINGVNQNEIMDENYRRASLVHLICGEKAAYGTTAGNAELHYTLRARTPENLEHLWEEIVQKIEEIISTYNQKHTSGTKDRMRVSFQSTEPFMANMNHPDAVSLIQNAAKSNKLTYLEMPCPNVWGEDFGYFTNLEGVKGAMFGLGAGEETPNLHSPDYDFPDELVNKGIAMFSEIVEILNEQQ